MSQKMTRFQALAVYFLDSFNPQPENKIMFLDMIYSCPDDMIPDAESGRYFAHEFVQSAFRLLNPLIEKDERLNGFVASNAVKLWMKNWVITNT